MCYSVFVNLSLAFAPSDLPQASPVWGFLLFTSISPRVSTEIHYFLRETFGFSTCFLSAPQRMVHTCDCALRLWLRSSLRMGSEILLVCGLRRGAYRRVWIVVSFRKVYADACWSNRNGRTAYAIQWDTALVSPFAGLFAGKKYRQLMLRTVTMKINPAMRSYVNPCFHRGDPGELQHRHSPTQVPHVKPGLMPTVSGPFRYAPANSKRTNGLSMSISSAHSKASTICGSVILFLPREILAMIQPRIASGADSSRHSKTNTRSSGNARLMQLSGLVNSSDLIITLPPA